MSDHHRKMIRFSLEHLEFLERQVLRLDEEIMAKIRELGYVKEWEQCRACRDCDKSVRPMCWRK